MVRARTRGAWLSSLAAATAVLAAGCAREAEVLDPGDYEVQSAGEEPATGAAPAIAGTDGDVAGAAAAESDAASDSGPDAASDSGSDTASDAASSSSSAAVSVAAADSDSGAASDSGAVAEKGAATTTVEPTASVEVIMRGFEHADGQVLVALWRTGKGFPEKGSRAHGKKRARVRAGRARVVFEDVPPGPFAVVAHHDEDRDFQMDTGVMGIPAEGYGFSRDASASFGPPSFEDARLWLKQGQQRRVRIRMRY